MLKLHQLLSEKKMYMFKKKRGLPAGLDPDSVSNLVNSTLSLNMWLIQTALIQPA